MCHLNNHRAGREREIEIPSSATAYCSSLWNGRKKGNKLIDYFVFFLLQFLLCFNAYPQRPLQLHIASRAIISQTNESIIEILNFAKTILQESFHSIDLCRAPLLAKFNIFSWGGNQSCWKRWTPSEWEVFNQTKNKVRPLIFHNEFTWRFTLTPPD